MNEIKVYQLSNGDLIENKMEAEKKQKQLDFEKAVGEFAEKHGCYFDGKRALYDAISENVEELEKIFEMRK